MLHSRLDRVAEQIKEALGEIFDREIENPEIPEFVTVHSVKISKDLHAADIYITFLGDDSDQTVAEVMKEINGAAGFIRGCLGRKVVMKYLPELKFHYTRATRYAADLEKLFHEPDFHAPPDSIQPDQRESEP